MTVLKSSKGKSSSSEEECIDEELNTWYIRGYVYGFETIPIECGQGSCVDELDEEHNRDWTCNCSAGYEASETTGLCVVGKSVVFFTFICLMNDLKDLIHMSTSHILSPLCL